MFEDDDLTDDSEEDKSSAGSTYVPSDVAQQNFNEENDDEKHEAAKSPAVLGEEDPFSGDATSSESPDIDDELAKVGLKGGNRPLGLDDELREEEF